MNQSEHFGHEDLRRDRLWIIGEGLAAARDSAQDHAEKNRGDTNWAVGCTAFDRERFEIVKLAKSHGWLTVINSGMEFLFSIGRVPIRFFHGEHERPSVRHRIPGKLEQLAQQQLLPGLVPSAYRLVIETDNKGYTTSVLLIQAAANGELIGPAWCVWSRAAISETPTPSPTAQPRPKVEVRDDDGHEMEVDGAG